MRFDFADSAKEARMGHRPQRHDTELAIVREQLDNLTRRRFLTGLTPSEETGYQELCASERMLLGKGPLGESGPREANIVSPAQRRKSP
jgi:hypothetical protein